MSYISIKKIGRIAILIINKSAKLNAIDSILMKELAKTISKLNKDKNSDAIILTGSGKSFISGGDIKEMANLNSKKAFKFALAGKELISSILNTEKAIIASVNGFALGGGSEVALACDIVIASKEAIFGQPESKLGLIPGFGGTQLLTKNLSLHKAKELIFRGNMINAKEAYSIGLVNYIAKNPLNKSIEIANEIILNSPYAIKEAKKLLNKDLSKNFKEESKIYATCFSNKDSKEGISAFLEKRKPNFKR